MSFPEAFPLQKLLSYANLVYKSLFVCPSELIAVPSGPNTDVDKLQKENAALSKELKKNEQECRKLQQELTSVGRV